MHFCCVSGYVLAARQKCAQVFVSKKQMEFDGFPKLVKTPARPKRRERHFENLLEKGHYFSEFSTSPRRGAKNGAKIASRRLPRSLWGSPGEPPGSQHRSTFRLWAPGPNIVFFWSPPGLPELPRGASGAQCRPRGAPGAPQKPFSSLQVRKSSFYNNKTISFE